MGIVRLLSGGREQDIHWLPRTGVGMWSQLQLHLTSKALVETDAHIVTNDHTELGRHEWEGEGSFIVLLRHDLSGEWIHSIYINGEEHKIGVEVEDEDERLHTLLNNFGIEISSGAYRACWSADPRELYPNYELINRKRRELLETLPVHLTKGSYQQVYGSMEWMEYPGLRYELWSHWTEDGIRYSRRPIGDYDAGDHLHKKKTTFLALEHPGNDTIWDDEDLRLKMRLVGEYMETDFLPIHLDVHHSTVTSKTYAPVFEMGCGHAEEVYSEHSSDLDFEIDVHVSDDGIGNTGDGRNSGNSSNSNGTQGTSDYSNIYKPHNDGSVTTLIRELDGVKGEFWDTCELRSPKDYTEMVRQFHTLGATVDVRFRFRERIIKGYKDGVEHEFDPTDNIQLTFLYTSPHKHKHLFKFVGESGRTYTRFLDVEVVDNVNVKIEFFTLKKVHRNPFDQYPLNISQSLTRVLEKKTSYRQFANLPLTRVVFVELNSAELEKYNNDPKSYIEAFQARNRHWWIAPGRTMAMVGNIDDPLYDVPEGCEVWEKDLFLPGAYDLVKATGEEDVLICSPVLEGGLRWSLPECVWTIRSLSNFSVHEFHGIQQLLLASDFSEGLRSGIYEVELSYNWGTQRRCKAISPKLR